MSKRTGGIRGRKLGLVAAIAAIACLGVASAAVANNLDRRTATELREVDRAATSARARPGCKEQYFVRGLHRVSQHKAVGKIASPACVRGSVSCARGSS